MKIKDAKVFINCPDRNFVTLKIITDEGIYGLGDATVNGRELAAKAYLEDLIPCLIGRDPAQIEDIWQYFYRGAYWRRGPITMAAIGAIDMALWDIKGKVLNTPVYNLLGGKSRRGVMVYGHANGKDIDDTIDQVGKYIDMGYLAIRAQTGVPGLPDAYGISSKDKLYYEPATKGLPQECVWSTEKYLNYVPKLFKKLREVYGDEPHFLHDSHHRLTPIEAARLGKELEPYHLFWLEDTVPAELQEGFRIIRQHTTTPLAVGEVFNTIWDTHILFTEQLIDYMRMSVVHSGGLTHLKKIASMAEVYHVKTGCHGPTDVSPISMAAALHFDIAVNNFGVQEYMRHTEKTDEVFPHAYSFNKGYLYPGDMPGLGVDFDEKLAARYPYERAYLPINRKLDGTLFNW